MTNSKISVVKCANSNCSALVIASRRFCSKHKPASKPCEVLGQIDSRQFARAMADTRQERTRQLNAPAVAAAREFIAVKPFATVAMELTSELRQESIAKATIAENGRLPNGRFVSKATKAEAEVTAAKLAMLGYGE